EFIASGRRLDRVKLYLSIGTEEDFQALYYGELQPGVERDLKRAYYGEAQLTSTFFRMAALLKHAAIPGLEIIVEPFAGEVHMTVYPMAFIHGVQAVFGLRRVAGLY